MCIALGFVVSEFPRHDLRRTTRPKPLHNSMPRHRQFSIDLVVAADVLEDRPVFGGELKHDPDVVFDAETPVLL